MLERTVFSAQYMSHLWDFVLLTLPGSYWGSQVSLMLLMRSLSPRRCESALPLF